jgi:hypothetical protein
MRALDGEERSAMGRAAQAYYAEHFEPALLAQRLVERFRRLQPAPLEGVQQESTR